RPQGRFRNPRQRRFRSRADLGVLILEKQDENGQLLVGARGQRALSGLHPHVAGDLAALEEIQERSGPDHRADRKVLKLVSVMRAVTTSPFRPSGLASAPFSVSPIAPASPTVSTSSRRVSIDIRSPAGSRRSIDRLPSTVAVTQQGRAADNCAVT